MMQTTSFLHADTAPVMDACHKEARAMTPADASHRVDDGCVLTQMRLCDLRIDSRQPRQYLPADLRVQAVNGTYAPPDVLSELQRRAQADDLEAYQYLADIQALAESLRMDGLIYPLKVETCVLPSGGQDGRIVDGERRYWASVWRSMQPESIPFAHATIGVLAWSRALDDTETQRVQWAANSQRRDLPVMIQAETVARIHAELASVFQHRRNDILALYGLSREARRRDRMLLVKITAIEMQKRTGKAVSERMLYRLLMFVNRMTTEARRLAIAANLDYRALETVAAAEPADQVGVIQNMLGNDEVEAKQQHSAASDPAIAHAMQQLLALTQIGRTSGRTWNAICRANAEVRQAYLLAAQDALTALTRHVHVIERLIDR